MCGYEPQDGEFDSPRVYMEYICRLCSEPMNVIETCPACGAPMKIVCLRCFPQEQHVHPLGK